MTILKVGACRSFHRVVGAREGHDVRLGGCWGAVGGVLGGPGGVAQAPKGGFAEKVSSMLGHDADILRL